MRTLQIGAYTVYRSNDCMENDLLVRPNTCVGAEVIVLCSLFMDYGHVLKIFDVDEEQYQRLTFIKTSEELKQWLDDVWPKDIK